MASTLIGHTTCPECDYDDAQVKKSEKEKARAYRWCKQCGAQYFTRSTSEEKQLLAKCVMPEPDDHEPIAPRPAPRVNGHPQPAPTPISAPVPAPAGIFSSIFTR